MSTASQVHLQHVQLSMLNRWPAQQIRAYGARFLTCFKAERHSNEA